DPAHHRFVEWLRAARAHCFGDLGEGPRADDRDYGAGQEEDPEDGVRVLGVLPDEAEDPEHEIPERASAPAGEAGAGSGRRVGFGHECDLFKSRAEGESGEVALRKTVR